MVALDVENHHVNVRTDLNLMKATEGYNKNDFDENLIKKLSHKSDSNFSGPNYFNNFITFKGCLNNNNRLFS